MDYQNGCVMGGKKMGIWENSVFLEERNSCQLAQLSLFLTHNYLVVENLNNGQHGAKNKASGAPSSCRKIKCWS